MATTESGVYGGRVTKLGSLFRTLSTVGSVRQALNRQQKAKPPDLDCSAPVAGIPSKFDAARVSAACRAGILWVFKWRTPPGGRQFTEQREGFAQLR